MRKKCLTRNKNTQPEKKKSSKITNELFVYEGHQPIIFLMNSIWLYRIIKEICKLVTIWTHLTKCNIFLFWTRKKHFFGGDQ